MADDNEFDFSDLPSVIAENEGKLAEAGVPVPPSAAVTAAPVSDLTPEDLDDIGHGLELEEKYGDSPVSSFVLGAVDTAGFSIPGRVLEKTGILSAEAQKEIRDRNPVADTFGTGVGIVGPLLMGNPSGILGAGVRTATAATRVGSAAEKAAARILEKGLGEAASSTLAKNIVRKSIEKSTQGAAEGGVMGFNQLLREDALGEADFNAESVLTHVGTGALYGGLANASLSLGGAAIKGAAKAASGSTKNLFDKAYDTLLNPVKAAEEIIDMPLAKKVKQMSTQSGKDMAEDMPRFLIEDVGMGATTDAKQLAAKVAALEQKSGQDIGRLLKEIDAKASTQIAEKQLNRVAELGEVANQLEAKYVAPFQELDPITGKMRTDKSFRAQTFKVQNMIDDIRTASRKKGPITGEELTALKRKMDVLAKGFYTRGVGAAPTVYEKAAFKARDLLNDLSYKYAVNVDSSLAQQLGKANKNAYYAKTILPSLMRKAEGSANFLGLRDSMLAGAGLLSGHGVITTALVGGKKLLESDFKHRMVILMGIEKANLAVSSKLKDAATNFVKGSARVGRPASVNALIGSALAQKREDGKSEAPKNKIEAYNNMTANLSRLIVKQEELLDKSVKAAAGISYGAPKTAEAMGQRMVKGVQFLHSKVPKRPYEATFPSGKQKPYTPSAQEIAKFERYLQAVDSPMSIMQDLESGTLTREHVEALRVVYPRLFSELQQNVLAELQDSDEGKLSYNKRVQISMLLEIPGDASLIGHNIAALQSNFQPPEMGDAAGGPAQGGGGPQPGSGRPPAGQGATLTASTRAASDTQGFAARRAKG